MNRHPFIILLAGGFPTILAAEQVILDYEAVAQTVVGTPFGLNIPRLTLVTGFFVYETGEAVDLYPGPERGWYQFRAGGGFNATFVDGSTNSHTLMGSVAPRLEVEDIPVNSGTSTIDTFRFLDGDARDPEFGPMKFDGMEDPSCLLSFRMTDDSGDAFPDDDLPDYYPMGGVRRPIGSQFAEYPFPHTFEIGDGLGPDDTGRMLLQLNWLSQRGETPDITSSSFSAGLFTIVFRSEVDRTYTIEFSTDQVSWDAIATGVPATGTATSFGDTDAVSRLGALPDHAYYRVRRE